MFRDESKRMKTIKQDFAKLTVLDENTVVAEANHGVEIDGQKVRQSIALIEEEMPGDYGLILNRKADYSVVPLDVYKFFASRERLKAIAIVQYKSMEMLPGNMEQRLYGREIEKFTSIEQAHGWVKARLTAE